jgi:hypothetical protein
MHRAKRLDTRLLTVVLVLYAFASLFHHVHNATFLTAYPNLPPSLSILNVYAAWAAVTTIGVVGYLLLRFRYVSAGLLAIAIYAACGLDGLAHYFVADFSEHSAGMHFTILAEVGTGIALICVVIATALQARRGSTLRS